jgi:hypothetical protein
MARIFNGNIANYLHAVGLKYNFGTNGALVFRARTSVDGGMVVMGRRNLIAGAGFAVARDPDFNALVLAVFGDGDKFKFSSFDKWPADGNVHSFILNKSGNSWTLYIDVATAVATESGTYVSTPDPDLFIGASNDLSAGGAIGPFNGQLDDVAMFSEPLGPTDRAAYLSGAPASALEAAATVGQHYYTMDNPAAEGEVDEFGAADLVEVGEVPVASGGPVLTGSITTDNAAPTGTIQSNPPSTLTGTIALDSAAPSGSLSSGAAPGTVVLTAWKNLSGMPLPSTPVARITLQRLSDGVQVLNQAGLTTSSDPVSPSITITNASLAGGTWYIALANNADGSVLGAELVQAT